MGHATDFFPNSADPERLSLPLSPLKRPNNLAYKWPICPLQEIKLAYFPQNSPSLVGLEIKYQMEIFPFWCRAKFIWFAWICSMCLECFLLYWIVANYVAYRRLSWDLGFICSELVQSYIDSLYILVRISDTELSIKYETCFWNWLGIFDSINVEYGLVRYRNESKNWWNEVFFISVLFMLI